MINFDKNKIIKNFWKKQVNNIVWGIKPKVIFEKKNENIEWFPDGKINIYENCIFQHIKKKKNALIFVDRFNKVKKLTYYELDQKIRSFCNFLQKKLGKNIHKRKVMIHSSASLCSAISMLSCARLGIHFSVIFEDLEEQAILNRIKLFNPDMLITRFEKNIFYSKFKTLKKIKNIKIIFFNDINFSLLKNNQKNKIQYFNSNKSLFTLFTSGSTGVPKGITHSSGGYLLYSVFTTKNQFGVKKNSTMFTASDAGWINGHTYAIFGPLTIGATSIILESPLLLLKNNILKTILNLNTSTLYLPVTLIRLMKSIYKKKIVKNHKIKTLGSMGEPLASSVGKWFSNFFNLKNKAIINTYFQTETGGIICSPTYKQSIVQCPHGSVGKPVTNKIKLNKLDSRSVKEVVITTPWPGCMKEVINGKSFYKKYFNKAKNFRLFDLGTKIGGNIYIHGRTDDVINIRGHRIGSGELEAVVLKDKSVKECSAIAIDDEIEGNIFILFLVKNNNQSKNDDENIKKLIFSSFGSFALPKKIFTITNLPKTRSGKILRRLLRDIYKNPENDSFEDLSTILDFNVLSDIRQKIINDKKQFI